MTDEKNRLSDVATDASELVGQALFKACFDPPFLILVNVRANDLATDCSGRVTKEFSNKTRNKDTLHERDTS